MSLNRFKVVVLGAAFGINAKHSGKAFDDRRLAGSILANEDRHWLVKADLGQPRHCGDVEWIPVPSNVFFVDETDGLDEAAILWRTVS